MLNYLDKVTYSKVAKDEIEMQGFLCLNSVFLFFPNGIIALIKRSEIIMFYRKYAWKYWSLFIFFLPHALPTKRFGLGVPRSLLCLMIC